MLAWCVSFFSENNPLKVDKILGLTFLRQEKTFHLLWLNFLLDSVFTTPIYSGRRSRFVNSMFPNKKHFATKTKLMSQFLWLGFTIKVGPKETNLIRPNTPWHYELKSPASIVQLNGTV